jgi:hypothetical protein
MMHEGAAEQGAAEGAAEHGGAQIADQQNGRTSYPCLCICGLVIGDSN